MVMQHKNKGFTLIELIISTSLLLVIMFTGYYAFALYSNKWEKRTDVFWSNTQAALAFDSINRLVESTYPYIVEAENKKPAIYYQASSTQVLFVSHSGLFTNRLAVVELAIERVDDNYSIIYRESSMDDNLILTQADVLNWEYQIVLIENLTSANFSYYGWQSLQQTLKNLESDENAGNNAAVSIIPPTWYDNHQLENQQILPIKIQLSFQDVSGKTTQFSIMLPENSHISLIRYLREDV